MTEDQEKRIEAIREEWAAEILKIPDTEPVQPGFDDSMNWPYRELERKYKPMIQAIKDEQ